MVHSSPCSLILSIVCHVDSVESPTGICRSLVHQQGSNGKGQTDLFPEAQSLTCCSPTSNSKPDNLFRSWQHD